MSNINNLHYVKKLIENRKKLEAGLSPQERAHRRNVQAAGGASPEFGAMLRGARAELAKLTRGVSGRASDPRFAFTRGEYSQGPKGTMSDAAKSVLAAQLATHGSSKKVKDAANKKWKELNASTEVTYRDGIRALFESVLNEVEAGVVARVGSHPNTYATVLNLKTTQDRDARVAARRAGLPVDPVPSYDATHIPPYEAPPKPPRQAGPTKALQAKIKAAGKSHPNASDKVKDHPWNAALSDVHAQARKDASDKGHHSVHADAMARNAVTDITRDLESYMPGSKPKK